MIFSCKAIQILLASIYSIAACIFVGLLILEYLFMMACDYQWLKPKALAAIADSVPSWWPVPPGSELLINYMPGSEKEMALIPWVGALSFLGYLSIMVLAQWGLMLRSQSLFMRLWRDISVGVALGFLLGAWAWFAVTWPESHLEFAEMPNQLYVTAVAIFGVAIAMCYLLWRVWQRFIPQFPFIYVLLGGLILALGTCIAGVICYRMHGYAQLAAVDLLSGSFGPMLLFMGGLLAAKGGIRLGKGPQKASE